MWKLSLVLLVLVHALVAQDSPQNTSAPEIIANTQQATGDNKTVLISQNQISNKTNGNETVNNNESMTLISHEDDQLPIAVPSGDLDDQLNFKYYWILLVGSSLAIIGLIVFRSFRLRRSRAEVRYGRPSDSEEIEPFSKSKWDQEDSSENEDEIFDINFLKNTRLQTHSDL